MAGTREDTEWRLKWDENFSMVSGLGLVFFWLSS